MVGEPVCWSEGQGFEYLCWPIGSLVLIAIVSDLVQFKARIDYMNVHVHEINQIFKFKYTSIDPCSRVLFDSISVTP